MRAALDQLRASIGECRDGRRSIRALVRAERLRGRRRDREYIACLRRHARELLTDERQLRSAVAQARAQEQNDGR